MGRLTRWPGCGTSSLWSFIATPQEASRRPMDFGSINVPWLLIRVPPLVFALTIHEFAHAWSAYLCGDPTARDRGRLTLDPLAHLDPIGSLCMLVAGFGWAKPVPVNPAYFRRPRRDDIFVSLAGVVANLATAITVALILRLTFRADFWMTRPGTIVWNMAWTLCVFSLCLMLFNLIPIPPLDGSHVLRNLLPRDAALAYDQFGRVAPFLLLLLIFTGGIGLVLGWPLWQFLVPLLLGPANFQMQL